MSRRYSNDPMVDLALHDGRLSIDDRESWERAFEDDPHEAGRQLVQLRPNEEVARRNAAGVSEDADYRRNAAPYLGVTADEVI